MESGDLRERDVSKQESTLSDALAIFGREAWAWTHFERVERLKSFWNHHWRAQGNEGEHPVTAHYDD